MTWSILQNAPALIHYSSLVATRFHNLAFDNMPHSLLLQKIRQIWKSILLTGYTISWLSELGKANQEFEIKTSPSVIWCTTRLCTHSCIVFQIYKLCAPVCNVCDVSLHADGTLISDALVDSKEEEKLNVFSLILSTTDLLDGRYRSTQLNANL